RSPNTSNPFRPWIASSYKNEFETTVISSMTTSTNTISNTMITTEMTTTTTLSSEREEEEKRREQDETMLRLRELFRRLQHPTGHNRSAVSSQREHRQRLFEPSYMNTCWQLRSIRIIKIIRLIRVNEIIK
ncbi:hypothetical protein ALC57_09478, partial [Trachymyrmex cornetzi]